MGFSDDHKINNEIIQRASGFSNEACYNRGITEILNCINKFYSR